ncbi:kinase-like domain-containing protein [Melanogaster broomeanus]|nr:kinase-like domain-containing protein [Melanogaster broomeanus]
MFLSLCLILSKSPVDYHRCNDELLDGATRRVHTLDIHNLGALAVIYATDKSRVKSFYSIKKDQAQSMIDLLQALLDLKSKDLDSWYRRRFLDAVIRLSQKSRLHPHSLRITGIDTCTPTNHKGGSGAIFQGNLMGRVVALKELQGAARTADQYLKARISFYDGTDFCQEAVVWRNVAHINCLPFYGVVSIHDGLPRTCLVSPWMENGDLSKYLKKNPDVLRLPLLVDIASGLEYLHTMQVSSPTDQLNIFVTVSGRACLADFGLATAHDTQAAMSTTTHVVSGTHGYMAPELIEARDDPSLLPQIDLRRCDMFAFGCIAYEVNNCHRCKQRALTVQPVPSYGQRPPRPNEERIQKLGLDDDMWEFIGSLWEQRPELRLSAESAISFLRYKSQMTGKGAARDSEVTASGTLVS